MISEKKCDDMKHSLGMWMYESFTTILHIQNYNLNELGLNKFTRQEKMSMAIAIFNQRVDIELAKEEGDVDEVEDDELVELTGKAALENARLAEKERND